MKNSLLIITIITLITAKPINVKITPGDHWNHSFKMGLFTVNTTPQFAIWFSDTTGKYLATLMVTEKSATSAYKGARDSRPSSLPIWSHARGVLSDKGNYMPSRREPLPDAVTSASPTADTVIQCVIPDSLLEQNLVLFVEVNGSMDFNEYYSENASEDHPGYNNAVNGQPSILYQLPKT